MKKVIKFMITFVLVVATMVTPITGTNSINTAIVKAATIKLTKTSLSLEVGKSAQLKVNGTKSKITWKSNKPSVASVNTTGKVTAVASGSAKITASVAKKTLTCFVTVKAVDKSDKTVTFNSYTIMYPYNMSSTMVDANSSDKDDIGGVDFYDTNDASKKLISLHFKNLPYPWMLVKSMLVKEISTEESIAGTLKDFKITDPTVSDINTDDLKTDLTDNFVKVSFNFKNATQSGKGAFYYGKDGDNLIMFTIIDTGDGSVIKAGDKMVNSLKK